MSDTSSLHLGSLLLVLPLVAGFAGNAVGQTLVFSNTPPGSSSVYEPGPGIFVSDDLTLEGGAADVVRYEVRVFSDGSSPYNVTTTLFSGDPCVGNPSAISGTSRTFTNILTGSIQTLSADFSSSPISVPGTVYLKLTVNDNDAGWVIGEAVEIGSSADLICVDQTSGQNPGYLNLGTTEASMAVQIWVSSPTPVRRARWGMMKALYGS